MTRFTNYKEEFYFNEVKDIFLYIWKEYFKNCEEFDKNHQIGKDAISIFIDSNKKLLGCWDNTFRNLKIQLYAERDEKILKEKK